jgi:hypothetical protein
LDAVDENFGGQVDFLGVVFTSKIPVSLFIDQRFLTTSTQYELMVLPPSCLRLAERK